MGLVDVSKAKDTQPPWNPHMGGIQTTIKWKVHIIPLSVQGWDGALRAHPIKRWSGLLAPLCANFQSNVDYGPSERVC